MFVIVAMYEKRINSVYGPFDTDHFARVWWNKVFPKLPGRPPIHLTCEIHSLGYSSYIKATEAGNKQPYVSVKVTKLEDAEKKRKKIEANRLYRKRKKRREYLKAYKERKKLESLTHVDPDLFKQLEDAEK